eukprot:4080249-Pyramimonas_sp.AAC.1
MVDDSEDKKKGGPSDVMRNNEARGPSARDPQGWSPPPEDGTERTRCSNSRPSSLRDRRRSRAGTARR